MVCLNGLNIDLKIAKFPTNIGRNEIISKVKKMTEARQIDDQDDPNFN